jgi:flagellar motility protein MotE (MotC chaperone)
MKMGYTRTAVAKKSRSGVPSVTAQKPAPQKRKPAGFPWFPLVIACLLAGFLIFGPHSWDEFGKLSQLIEVDAVQSAQAESSPDKIGTENSAKGVDKKAGKKDSAQNATSEKNSGDDGELKAGNKEQTKSWTPEEIALFRTLEQRKKDLDQRENDLNRMDAELQKQKGELESRLKNLEETRRKIAGQLSEKVQTDQDRVDKLVTMYANMKPASAANVFKDLNEDLAVEILGKMKQKNAAEILNLLPSEKAQRISEKFAGYRRSGN